MNKYQKKIYKKIGDIDLELKVDKLIISDTVRAALSNPSSLNMEEEYDYPAIHQLDEPPIKFLFIKELYQSGILQQIHGDVPDLTDFKTYLAWCPGVTFPDKLLYSGVRDHKELSSFYDILFGLSGNRRFLHRLLYDNNFVSTDVHQDAETSDLVYQRYVNSMTTLHVFRKKGSTIDLKKVEAILSVMHEIAKSIGKAKKVEITMFISNQKKTITRRGVLGPENVNSGSTLHDHYVNVWRDEELYKVLIHELIHYYGFDYFCDQECVKTHQTKIKIDGRDFCNESYTESLAILIYSLVIGGDINRLISDELKFYLFQVAKIINHYGGKSWDDISNITFTQGTSVFSYYVVKALIFMNLNKFIEMINTHGLVVNCQQFKAFARELVDSEIDSKYKDIINRLISNTDWEDKNYITNTMRMSFMEWT